jgi:hypothetical protein
MRDGCEGAGVLDPLRLCAAAQPRAALLNLNSINNKHHQCCGSDPDPTFHLDTNPESRYGTAQVLHMLRNHNFFSFIHSTVSLHCYSYQRHRIYNFQYLGSNPDISQKLQNRRHKQRSSQHTLARQKRTKKISIFWTLFQIFVGKSIV